MARQKSWIL